MAALQRLLKACLVEGAAYHGTLTQFTALHELRYDLGAELPTVPAAVAAARTELGWGKGAQGVEHCCEGTCTLEQMGLSNEPVVITADVREGKAVRVLIMSLERPELGRSVCHLDVRREELTGGDEDWWLGQEVVIRAARMASSSDVRAQVAMQRLGLSAGAVFTGKCNHPSGMFRPYDFTLEFGKPLPAVPAAAVEARTALGWTEAAEVCCAGTQSVPEFGESASEVVILADLLQGPDGPCRRLLVVPTSASQLGITVGCLSADAMDLTGGESGWWVGQAALFTLHRVSS